MDTAGITCCLLVSRQGSPELFQLPRLILPQQQLLLCEQHVGQVVHPLAVVWGQLAAQSPPVRLRMWRYVSAWQSPLRP